MKLPATIICLCVALSPARTASPELEAKPSPERTTLKIEGWTVEMETDLLNGEHAELGDRVRRLIAGDLTRIALVVPEARVSDLRRVRIVVDRELPGLRNMQYHPSLGWLRENGYGDDLERVVHIPVAGQYASREHFFQQPWALLHELAHAFHDQVLGWDDPRILAAYEGAQKSKKYLSVLHINGSKVRHYALTNHKEYFAESTEAWFGANDFYPWVRAELKEHDPEMAAVLTAIWSP